MVNIFKEYNKPHSWQYDIRLKKYDKDIIELGFSETDLKNMRVKDFDFAISDKSDFEEIKQFIQRYEWLGTLPPYPTHYFTARYNGTLAGVLIYTMPNAFSKILGDNTKNLERLLARGASASWTPKNLASAFIAWSTNWLVMNTQYRLFTAYSDPMAKELGTVYQASNWLYLGQSSGSPFRYREPGSKKWVSDRKFRNVASFKRYARENKIPWLDDYSIKRKMMWENMPEAIETFLRAEGKRKQAECEKSKVPPKHKYALVKGRNKTETKELMKLFEKYNPKAIDLKYPKVRGS